MGWFWETKELVAYDVIHPTQYIFHEDTFIPWISYDSLNIELPDGYLYFNPIVNWGKYREEAGHLMMPVSVRLNHAAADGYLVAMVYKTIEKEIETLCKKYKIEEKAVVL